MRRAILAVLLVALPAAPSAAASNKFQAGISGGSQPLGIVAGPDGNLWFTEFDGGRLGRITPAGVVTEYPTGAQQLTGITAGPDGALWFLDYAGRVVRATTRGGVAWIASLPAASEARGIAAGPGRQPVGHAGTPERDRHGHDGRRRHRPHAGDHRGQRAAGDHRRPRRRALVHGVRGRPHRTDHGRRRGQRAGEACPAVPIPGRSSSTQAARGEPGAGTVRLRWNGRLKGAVPGPGRYTVLVRASGGGVTLSRTLPLRLTR